MKPSRANSIRFGVFELDPSSGELLKSGVRVRLQEQPLQVLKALLERPGEIVTREELQQLLWPDGTFVDFDDGLSTAVRKIRTALGDSATNPRFVETLPKRGYRFVAPVERNVEHEAAAPPATPRPPGRYMAAGLAAVAVVAAAIWLRPAPEQDAVPEPPVPVPLTSYPGAELDPSFSPDGSQVAFSWTGKRGDNTDIYVTVVGGAARSRLTDDPAPDVAPAWSPDGSRIAFARIADYGIDSIHMVSPLGGAERKLIDAEVQYFDARAHFNMAWSPDGTQLAIPHDPGSTGSARIALLSIETGEMRDLTVPRGVEADRHVAFSPDGSSIVFARKRQYSSWEAIVSPLAGGSLRTIASLPWNITSLIWSPDGTDILFVSSQPGVDVWSVSADGGDPRPLKGPEGDVFSLAVSSARDRLAYSVQRPMDRDIWKVALGASAGDAESFEWIASNRSDAHAQISHDGRRIAFRSARSGFPEIWTAVADGSNPTPLTSLKTGAGGTPRWSPDDRLIAFNSNAHGTTHIYVIPSEGGAPRQLTSGDDTDSRPAWSHDGRWVYFASNRGGVFNVWRVSTDGAELQQVTQDGAYNPKLSPDGRTLYFTKPRTYAVWRMDLETAKAEPFLTDWQGAAEGSGGGTGCFESLSDGFYYLEGGFEQATLKRLDHASGKVTDLADVERGFTPVNCFSLSPDRTWFLYTKNAPLEADLMLLEGVYLGP